MKILIADDSKISRRLLRTALAEWDFDVIEAHNGEEAWQFLSAADAPRLAILDRYMPGMEGVEICRKLRETQSIPYVYAILLTAQDDRANLIEGLESGADDFLGKPFDPEELEQRLRAGVRVLQLEDRLRASQASLRETNEHLMQMCETAQRFVDNLSHEFRSPLTVINEYVSLLRDGVVGDVSLDSEQCRFLDIVSDRADDLNTMVDDMLDASKLESGLLRTWKRAWRVDEIVERVRPNLEKKAAIRGVALEIAIPADLGEVYCDAEKAGRVVINLAINAIKFSQEPGLVRLWAHAVPDRGEIVIGVSDNGPGIEKEKLVEIFERFRQLGTTTRDVCKGFGLGLNIASELVELNFGRMHVESELGSGSTFSFSLPLANPDVILSRYLGHLEAKGESSPTLALITTTTADESDDRICDEVDALLNYAQRGNELLLRRDQHHWLLVAPTEESDGQGLLDAINEVYCATNRNRPQGDLPELNVAVAAMWPRDGEADELRRFVEDSWHQAEACHAS